MSKASRAPPRGAGRASTYRSSCTQACASRCPPSHGHTRTHHARARTVARAAAPRFLSAEPRAALAPIPTAGVDYVLKGAPVRVEGGCNVTIFGEADGAIISRGHERGRLLEVRDANLEVRNVRLEGGRAQVKRTALSLPGRGGARDAHTTSHRRRASRAARAPHRRGAAGACLWRRPAMASSSSCASSMQSSPTALRPRRQTRCALARAPVWLVNGESASSWTVVTLRPGRRDLGASLVVPDHILRASPVFGPPRCDT